MAELVSKTKIDWDQHDDPIEILVRELRLTPAQLFQPGSPLLPHDLGGKPLSRQPADRPLGPQTPVRLLNRERADSDWADANDFGVPLWHALRQGTFPTCYYLAAIVSLLFAEVSLRAEPSARVSTPSNPRRKFPLFETDFTRKDFDLDERLKFNGAQTFFSLDREELSWPGLWEKAFACLAHGVASDTPDVEPLEVTGWPSAALAALTGTVPLGLTGTDSFLFQLRTDWIQPSGRLKRGIAAVISTGTGFISANLTPNHAYSLLGLVAYKGAPYIILNNPSGMRKGSDPKIAWNVLEKISWTKPFGRAARKNRSGVLAVPVASFVQLARNVDVHIS